MRQRFWRMIHQRAWLLMGLASAFAISVVLRRRALRLMSTKDLAALWVGGIETMLLKGGTISLAPTASADESRASFGGARPFDGVAFALTAFDPPGVSRSRAENAAANGDLWKELRALRAPYAWRAFGVDVDEGWREDGFAVAWPEGDADAARPGVVAAARAFDQGAIYEYAWRDGALVRRTRGVAAAVDETTFMRAVSHDDLRARSDLFALPWAGPADFP